MSAGLASRIHRGFHRIGAVGAAIILGLGVFSALAASPVDRWEWIIGDVVAAALIYALSRALGWITAGIFVD